MTTKQTNDRLVQLINIMASIYLKETFNDLTDVNNYLISVQFTKNSNLKKWESHISIGVVQLWKELSPQSRAIVFLQALENLSRHLCGI